MEGVSGASAMTCCMFFKKMFVAGKKNRNLMSLTLDVTSKQM